MFEPYHPERWWFEIFELLRKVMLSGILQLLADGYTHRIVLSDQHTVRPPFFISNRISKPV